MGFRVDAQAPNTAIGTMMTADADADDMLMTTVITSVMMLVMVVMMMIPGTPPKASRGQNSEGSDPAGTSTPSKGGFLASDSCGASGHRIQS